MLKNADFSQEIATLARCATTAKTMLMYAVFILIIVLLIIFVVNKKRANKTNDGEK